MESIVWNKGEAYREMPPVRPGSAVHVSPSKPPPRKENRQGKFPPRKTTFRSDQPRRPIRRLIRACRSCFTLNFGIR